MIRTKPVTVTLPEDLLKEVDKMARKGKISRSELVAEALKRRMWLSRLERLQEKALPYARKLNIETDEDVKRILNS